MTRKQKAVSVKGYVILILAILNGIILEYAFTKNEKAYWLLILSLPLLLMSIRYALRNKTFMVVPAVLSHSWEKIRKRKPSALPATYDHQVVGSKLQKSPIKWKQRS